MKKILVILFIAMSVLGCKKEFLDREPTTSEALTSFYKTPANGKQALTAIYNSLLADDYWSPIIYSEIASDDCAGGGGSGDGGGYQRYDRGMKQLESSANQTPWLTYYGGIYRANVYLQNEGNIDWTGNEALQKQYRAEAMFLRGYFHFLLARMFGEVPYLDHPLGVTEYPGRTEAETLYYNIIQDLKYCAENGISDTYIARKPANWGRVTKWAAEAMIARVYLYYSGYYNSATIKDFTVANALTYTNDVIVNSQHSLVAKYASLWRVSTYSELGDISQYAGEANSEAVWSITYNITGNSNSSYGAGWWERMIGPRSTNVVPYGQGWGAMPVEPSLWNAFDVSDTRRGATILSWTAEGKTYDYLTNQQAQYTGYNSKKYEIASVLVADTKGNMVATPENVANGGTNWQFDAFEDYMVIRYADVLLMGAELLVIQNGAGDGTALTYANQVRSRAFGDATHNLTTLTRDDIFAERKLEFACEGLRYWDILRSCQGDFTKLTSILTVVDNTDGGQDYSNSADVISLDVNGSNFTTTKGLFQISDDELTLMQGAISQNPGY